MLLSTTGLFVSELADQAMLQEHGDADDEDVCKYLENYWQHQHSASTRVEIKCICLIRHRYIAFLNFKYTYALLKNVKYKYISSNTKNSYIKISTVQG